MPKHSKADLPIERLTNSVTVVDPVLSIILRGVSVASVHLGTPFYILSVCSTIKGVLSFYFCYLRSVYSLFYI